MADCLFCAIVAGEIPATTVLETDRILAFRDINPQAPTHVLITMLSGASVVRGFVPVIRVAR